MSGGCRGIVKYLSSSSSGVSLQGTASRDGTACTDSGDGQELQSGLFGDENPHSSGSTVWVQSVSDSMVSNQVTSINGSMESAVHPVPRTGSISIGTTSAGGFTFSALSYTASLTGVRGTCMLNRWAETAGRG
jgi:hypothetical protein